MKTLIKHILFSGLMVGTTQAATVTLATGLAGAAVQGIRLTTEPDNSVVVASSQYYVGVGRYDFDTLTFTPWATMVLDTPTGSPSTEISGTFSTQNSISSAMDNRGIQVYAGLLGATPSFTQGVAFTPVGDNWVIFETGVPSHIFPVVTGTGAVSVTLNGPVSVFTNSGVNVVATGNAGNQFNGTSNTSGEAGYYFLLVPEPSAALLGAIGALGLLRRRRN